PGEDHRVYLDGVELPALFHAGGFRTTVHPALLDAASLTPAAPEPDYGRALGGTIELRSQPALQPGARLQLAADFIDASLAARGVLGPLHGTWTLRGGYLDRLQRALARDTLDVVQLPEYADSALRLAAPLDHAASLTATWIGSHDRAYFTRGDRSRAESR